MSQSQFEYYMQKVRNYTAMLQSAKIRLSIANRLKNNVLKSSALSDINRLRGHLKLQVKYAEWGLLVRSGQV